ncbi:MAG TPA: hypothetical protein VJG66_02895 [Patescibacteria group bacterium]|nr:hypothetical protein [Patescibacteria group bacterium]
MKQQFSKEEIEKTINYLKTNRPDLPATKEEAIKILAAMQGTSESFVKTVIKAAKKNSKKSN